MLTCMHSLTSWWKTCISDIVLHQIAYQNNTFFLNFRNWFLRCIHQISGTLSYYWSRLKCEQFGLQSLLKHPQQTLIWLFYLGVFHFKQPISFRFNLRKTAKKYGWVQWWILLNLTSAITVVQGGWGLKTKDCTFLLSAVLVCTLSETIRLTNANITVTTTSIQWI